jgi:hypothetical protein
MAVGRLAYNIRRPIWIARILVLASAVGIFISSYIFYNPHYYPFTISGISQQFSQAVLYGGSLLVLAGLMWLWPIVGSIPALLWVFFRFIQDFGTVHTQMPLPLYFFLYGMFIVGSVLYLITDVVKEKAPRTAFETIVRVRWVARILSLVSLAGFAIAFTWITRPVWFLAVVIPVVPLAAIAWFWSVPGGVLLILGSIIALVTIVPMHCDFDVKMARVVPWIIFLVAGVLYLISVWMKKRQPG